LVYPKDTTISEATRDEQYIPTLGMEIVAGRNFSKDFAMDSLGMIINESAVRAFGWNTMGAIGKIWSG
jgi:putative ABC transport system permease protein